MTCCFFSSLKTLLTCGGYRPHAQINVLARLYMAGFQVIIYGRFWVFTEAQRHESLANGGADFGSEFWPTSAFSLATPGGRGKLNANF